MKLPKQRWYLLFPVFLIGLAAYAGTRSPRTIPDWGQVIDPDGDCTVSAKDQTLTITVPGTTHDLSSYHHIYKKRNAPRVLQEVDGNFTVQVKVSGVFDPGRASTLPETDPFNGAGLLLWANSENFLRFERNVWTTPNGGHSSYQPLFQYWKDDTDLTPNTPSTHSLFKGHSTYLRLTRQGNQIRAALSHDGVKWIETKPVTVHFPQRIKVGLDAINTSKKAFTVEFTKLKLVSKRKSNHSDAETQTVGKS